MIAVSEIVEQTIILVDYSEVINTIIATGNEQQ